MNCEFSPALFCQRIIDAYPGIESLIKEEFDRNKKEFMFDGGTSTILKNKGLYGSKYKDCYCHVPLPRTFRGEVIDNPEYFFNFRDILEICLNWKESLMEIEFDSELENKIHELPDVSCPIWDARLKRGGPGCMQNFNIAPAIFVHTHKAFSNGKEVYGVFAYGKSILKIYTNNTLSYIKLRIPIFRDRKGHILREPWHEIREIPKNGKNDFICIENNIIEKFSEQRLKEVSGLELILEYLHHANTFWYKTIVDRGIVRLFNEPALKSKDHLVGMERVRYIRDYIRLSIDSSNSYVIPTR